MRRRKRELRVWEPALRAIACKARSHMKPVHEDVEEILSDDGEDRYACPKQIRLKAMDFLARREYGQTELIKKLADKGYKRTIVEEEVERLADEGLQSDTRFAEGFVQSRINQGKGPVLIRADLAHRGVDDGIIDEAIESADIDWFELAAAEREKKFGPDQPPNFKEKARQMRFLQYRGFEQDHISAAF